MFIEFDDKLINLNNVRYIEKFDKTKIYINFVSDEADYLEEEFAIEDAMLKRYNEIKELLTGKFSKGFIPLEQTLWGEPYRIPESKL